MKSYRISIQKSYPDTAERNKYTLSSTPISVIQMLQIPANKKDRLHTYQQEYCHIHTLVTTETFLQSNKILIHKITRTVAQVSNIN
jgi:hypothetical protein